VLVPLDESPDVLGMVVCALGRRPNRYMILANWAFHAAPAVSTRCGRDDRETCGNRVVQGSTDLFAGCDQLVTLQPYNTFVRGRGDHARNARSTGPRRPCGASRAKGIARITIIAARVS